MIENCVEEVSLFTDRAKAREHMIAEFIHLAVCVMHLSEQQAREVVAEELDDEPADHTRGCSIVYEEVDVYVIPANDEKRSNSAKNQLPFRHR